ncbi:hypothetical protein [Natrinema salifodinae]|nr:hypothetical protein [Natrinema salifodinae]
MFAPLPPQPTPFVSDQSVLETAIVAVGATVALVLTALSAFVAASLVGDDTVVGLSVSLFVGLATLVAIVVGARAIGRRLARRLDRRRRSARVANR